MRTLVIACLLFSVGCAGARRVDPAGRPSDDNEVDFTRIFIPTEKHDTEICVEYQDGEAFYEDCIEAREFHAIMRAAGRSGS